MKKYLSLRVVFYKGVQSPKTITKECINTSEKRKTTFIIKRRSSRKGIYSHVFSVKNIFIMCSYLLIFNYSILILHDFRHVIQPQLFE